VTKTVDELQANWRQAMSGAHAAWLRDRSKEGEVAMTKTVGDLMDEWRHRREIAKWAASDAAESAEKAAGYAVESAWMVRHALEAIEAEKLALVKYNAAVEKQA